MEDRKIEVPSEKLNEISKILRNIGEPNKLKILFLLKNGPLPVCVISYILGLDQTLISHLLKTLRDLGLIEYSRKGNFKLYSLSESSIKVLDLLNEILK
ncbi:winged helix-turn-helix transcriptional regulator [Fervidicoccus fontis]|uniref:Winged helix-turn-helix transcriptional regulator n=1 Tax=Fervidicoccus fontis TaxID=683846 RepID=A0A843AGE9_9CREN|nr:metalloregulator ArsR/SmtB family transcription factor [Fervidicoccus fontis]MBE9390689.1 winged helix-turn-helix transcriptional regulator [Fervidicoccus fontis]